MNTNTRKAEHTMRVAKCCAIRSTDSSRPRGLERMQAQKMLPR